MRLRKVVKEASFDEEMKSFEDFVSLWNKNHKEEMKIMDNGVVAVAEGRDELWVAQPLFGEINLKHYSLKEDSMFPLNDFEKPSSVLRY